MSTEPDPVRVIDGVPVRVVESLPESTDVRDHVAWTFVALPSLD